MPVPSAPIFRSCRRLNVEGLAVVDPAKAPVFRRSGSCKKGSLARSTTYIGDRFRWHTEA